MWQLEELQRLVHTRILAATMAAAMGAEVEIPDESAIRDQYDDFLRLPPKDERADDPEKYALMRGLGLRP